MQQAWLKNVFGTEKKSKIIYEDELKITAWHEAGHAVVMDHFKNLDPVHRISIIPCGSAGGYTLAIPKRDRKKYVLSEECFNEIVVALAGRNCEKLALKDVSTGCSQDLAVATKMARDMVTKYGFSKAVGPIAYAESPSYLAENWLTKFECSEEYAAKIDQEVNKIISKADGQCVAILNEKMDKVEIVAKYLYKREKIEEEEFKEIMSGKITLKDVEEMEVEGVLLRSLK